MILLVLIVRSIILIAIALVIHFVLGWPIWVGLLLAGVITTIPSWIVTPVRGALNVVNYVVLRIIWLLPVYVLTLVVLYLIGHPSW